MATDKCNTRFALLALALTLCVSALAQRTPVVYEPDAWLTHTLPVLHINTEHGDSILSKTDYLPAVYWLDAAGIDGYSSIGTADDPLPLEIRGRGNSTWKADKKPYRLRLGEKAALLGMAKDRHWCLMAEIMGIFLADYLAFDYSRRLQLPWTPQMRPVELVLNGNYEGLYFITEKIRVDKHRVDIAKQSDRETDLDLVTGGWLMEIDNVYDTQQFRINDRSDGSRLRFTWHSPDTLSTVQRSYIGSLLTLVDSLIYVSDKHSREWEQYIDIDRLARFYIVNELMDNGECFSGSCYFYKNRGRDTKFYFGPVWDAGSCFCHHALDMQSFIYDNPPRYSHQHWIGEIAKFSHFQAVVRHIWNHEVINGACSPDATEAVLDSLNAMLQPAAEADYARWGDLGVANLARKCLTYKRYTRKKYDFLDSKWRLPTGVEATTADTAYRRSEWFTIRGQRIAAPAAPGVYIHNGAPVLVR